MLLQTKFHIPIQHGQLVKRPTLLQTFNQSHGGSLILICAPAGYGKTTLATQWLQNTKRPAAWLSLDNTDNDPVQFWRYIIASLQTYEKDIGVNTLQLLLSSEEKGLENCIITLINDLTNLKHKEPNKLLVLALDDYHLITNKETTASFSFFLSHLPQTIQVLITTRQMPEFSLARFRSQNQLIEITIDDLQFNTKQCEIFMQDIMQISLDKKSIDTLLSRTEGWVAGLQLASLSLQHTKDTQQFITNFSAHHHHITEYLLDEVFKQQSQEIQLFLTYTSLLPKLSGALCDAVMQRQQSDFILSFLEQANLFLVALDDNRTWFRYHEMFRELLEKKLIESQPELISDLRKRAGLWLEQEGYLEAAFAQVLPLKDWDWLIQLIDNAGQIKAKQGEFHTLNTWLEKFPNELIQSKPKLLILKAFGLTVTSEANIALALLDNAENLLSEANTSPTTIDFNHSTEEARLYSDIGFLRFYFSRFLQKDSDQIAELDIAEQDKTNSASNYFALGINHYVNGELIIAGDSLLSALQQGKKENTPYIVFNSFSLLARVYYLNGRFQDIFRIRENLRSWTESQQIGSLPLSEWQDAALAEIYAELNQFDRAHACLKTLIDHINKSSNTDWSSIPILLHQMTVFLRQRNYDAANKVLNQVDHIYQNETIDWSFFGCASIGALRAHIALLKNDLISAEHWAEQQSTQLASDKRFSHEEDRIILAKIWIAQKNHAKAIDLLNDIRLQSQPNNRLTHEIQTYILETIAYLNCDDSAKAISSLKLALTKAANTGYIRMFLDAGPSLGRLIYQIAEFNIAPSYSRLLLAQYGSTSQPSNIDKQTNQLATQLSRRELEVLELMGNGLKNREIAIELHISPETVKSHSIRIYKKMAVNNRTQALSKARALGLLSNL